MPKDAKHRFRRQLYEKQGGLCYYCGREMTFTRRKSGQPGKDFATFEHLTPKRVGGKMNSTNIVLACRVCNNAREREYHRQNPHKHNPPWYSKIGSI